MASMKLLSFGPISLLNHSAGKDAVEQVVPEVSVLPPDPHHARRHPQEEDAQVIDRVGAQQPLIEPLAVIVDYVVRGMAVEEADSEEGEAAGGEALEDGQQPGEEEVEQDQGGDSPRSLGIGHFNLRPVNKPSMAQCHFQKVQIALERMIQAGPEGTLK